MMSSRPNTRYAGIAVLLGLGALMVAAGCGKNQEQQAAAPTANGQALFASAGCARCHGTPGQGTRGMAPDLSHEGSQHDQAWIAAQIKDPKSHNPGSRMPAFGGRLPDPDTQAIAAYLAGLK